jgi:hypothetical protein
MEPYLRKAGLVLMTVLASSPMAQATGDPRPANCVCDQLRGLPLRGARREQCRAIASRHCRQQERLGSDGPASFPFMTLAATQEGKRVITIEGRERDDELDILFVSEFDEETSPFGAKGLRELTAVSVASAIADIVYRATRKRVRHLPTTVERLL